MGSLLKRKSQALTGSIGDSAGACEAANSLRLFVHVVKIVSADSHFITVERNFCSSLDQSLVPALEKDICSKDAWGKVRHLVYSFSISIVTDVSFTSLDATKPVEPDSRTSTRYPSMGPFVFSGLLQVIFREVTSTST